MIKPVQFLLGALVALALASCQTPLTADPTNPVATVHFAVRSDFHFGNEASGFATPTKIWLAGDFNGWTPNDPAYELTNQGNGYFSLDLIRPVGTVLLYKLIVQTSLSPSGGYWWTDMGNAYSSGNAVSPPADLVSFQDDGYQGFNAAYSVK